MKKIFYSFTAGLVLVGLALVGLFGGCTKVNDQFSGEVYDSLTRVTNPSNYTYTFVDADYKTIGTVIQKPINDLITPIQNTIKVKQDSITNKLYGTKADSLSIVARINTLNAQIAALKLDPDYVRGGNITSIKYLPIKDLINYGHLVLDTKFKYFEENVSTTVTYNAECDTTGLTAFSLTAANYTTMGVPNPYFNSSYNPTFYIPIYFKQIYPYAKAGDKKFPHYKYNTGTSAAPVLVTRWMVSTYDGTTWSNGGNLAPKTAKFVVKNGAWTYIDSDILIGLNKTTGIGSNLGDFIPINVSGAQVWAWNASYNYMMMTGYVSGAYYDNEDWLVSPAMNFTERNNPTLTFNHVGRYFGDAAGIYDKMKIAISVWVSTTSDGTSIVPEQWTKLTLPDAFYPSGNDWTFISSTPLSLAAYKGQNNVRIAFKYLSSHSDNAAGTWEVKDVYVFEK